MLEGVTQREVNATDEWLGWRRRNINASEAGALWGPGVHDFTSAYELWADRSGKISTDKSETKAMVRGRRMEAVAIEYAQDERPAWNIWRPHVYLEHPGWRIGCTPDAYFGTFRDGRNREGVLQIKTVGKWAFEKKWKDPDTQAIEPPLWIAVQASIEALMSKREEAAVGAMVISDAGIIDMHVIEVPLKPGILTKLRPLVQDFWRRVEQDDPYSLDWERERDRETMRAIYADDDGSQIDLSDDEEFGGILTERERLKEVEAEASAAIKARKLIDDQIIARMGNAAIASFGSRVIKAATVRKGAYSVKPTTYRQVRIK